MVQSNTILKHALTNIGNSCVDCNGLETDTFKEGILTNASHCTGYRDISQAASRKGIITDSRYSFRDINICQSGTTIKHALDNFGQR